MNSPAGFYLGFMHEIGEPYSRETVYMTEASAKQILDMIRS